jgi:hypothetical protein
MRQIKPPTELRGLKERLTRARELQARGDAVGKRYDAALNLIEERVNQSELQVVVQFEIPPGGVLR